MLLLIFQVFQFSVNNTLLSRAGRISRRITKILFINARKVTLVAIADPMSDFFNGDIAL